MPHVVASSVDPQDVAGFAAIADQWWDPAGPLQGLHRLNPARLGWIRDRLCGHFGRDPGATRPLAGLKLIDVGCGGGLIAEPLARMGADVMAIDAAPENIAAAQDHAARLGLEVDYRAVSVESLAASAAAGRFDAVVTMEVLEHVADRAGFLAACGALARPGGALLLATLNRTPKSYLQGIVIAERVLRWAPVGAHRWRKFVKPSEAAADLRAAGLRVAATTGLTLDMATGGWRTRDGATDVNYMMMAVKD